MDFIGIIRSLEELLYEVMSWLIFYPRTMWRIVVNPVAVSAYSDAEQDDSDAGRFTDTLSPPLFLLISMMLTHALATSLGQGDIKASSEAGKEIVSSAKNLLAVRAVIFAAIPLVIASIAMRHQQIAIDRQSLRRPFYSQCFLVTPFIMLVQTGLIINEVPSVADKWGGLVILGGFGWFIWAQTGWFAARFAITRRHALGWAVGAVLAALLFSLAIAAIVASSL